MAITTRTQPYRLSGDMNSDKVEQLDYMLQILFDDLKKVGAAVGVSTTSTSITTTGSGSVGAQGPPGPAGNDGEDGIQGPPGLRGVDGAAGATGAAGPITQGPMGMDGADGEDAWPMPGVAGSPGPAGNNGADGIDGIAGPIGPMVFDGIDGEDAWPIPGPTGAAGTDGAGSSTSAWEGNIVACAGDGNPNSAIQGIIGGSAAPTPTQITTSIGRCSYFRLKTAITVANIRWYGVNNTTAVYHIAIYRASDNVRMSSDNNPNTIVSSWNSIADSFTLAAGVLYYCVVSVDSAVSTAGIAGLGGSIAATTGAIQVLPTGWPGNLDIDIATPLVSPYAFANTAVTLGVLPNPGNTPTAMTAWTGNMPAIFLDAT